MRNIVQLCSAANNILLIVNETTLSSFFQSFLREKKSKSLRFPKIFIKKKLGD